MLLKLEFQSPFFSNHDKNNILIFHICINNQLNVVSLRKYM